MKNKIKNNIPNAITISRMLASILAPIALIFGSLNVSIGLYVYGAISDFFDGIAARKLNAITKLGKKLDPISDKLYALSLILPALVLGNFLMLIPLIYEAKIAYINYRSDKEYKNAHTERVGKFKTASLFPTMILGLLSTKFYGCYFLFAPSLVLTTKLQIKSIASYKKQYEKEKLKNGNNIDSIENITIDNNSKKVSNKEKLIYLRNEFVSYLYQDECYNVKRRELKR